MQIEQLKLNKKKKTKKKPRYIGIKIWTRRKGESQ